LSSGYHTVTVVDEEGGVQCANNKNKYSGGYPKCTPNADKIITDTWNIFELQEDLGSIRIFDRYSKLLKEIRPR
jgi:hypothetical protein